MVRELHIRARVQPGGKIEVESPELTEGEDVDVTISSSADETAPEKKRSIADIMAEAPGHLLFKSAKDVDDYIREERASWDR